MRTGCRVSSNIGFPNESPITKVLGTLEMFDSALPPNPHRAPRTTPRPRAAPSSIGVEVVLRHPVEADRRAEDAPARPPDEGDAGGVARSGRGKGMDGSALGVSAGQRSGASVEIEIGVAQGATPAGVGRRSAWGATEPAFPQSSQNSLFPSLARRRADSPAPRSGPPAFRPRSHPGLACRAGRRHSASRRGSR